MVYLGTGGAPEVAGLRATRLGAGGCSDLRCLGLKILQYQEVLQEQEHPLRHSQELSWPQLEGTDADLAAFISRDPVAEADTDLVKRNRNADDYDFSNSMGLARGNSLSNHLSRGLHERRMSDFISVDPPKCVCGYTESTIDLGHLRFPRILPTLECTAGSCGAEPYSCKSKIYKVWVLKQKEAGDSKAVHGPLLPEPFRASYELEMVPVTVACECSA